MTAFEAESTERWISGKSQNDLLSDLRVYSSRLRDDPHSIQDRLRVAAIQLRLGRIDEALVHYEGVLRGYVAQNQILSAIALCRRILGICPDLPRLKHILAALYARVPHGARQAAAPVSPLNDQRSAFVVQDTAQAAVKASTTVIADRIFDHHSTLTGQPSELRLSGADLQPTTRYERQQRRCAEAEIVPLRPGEQHAQVILLTRRKR